ncbi:MAG TPA: response regulator [Opitutaceae bacterium]|nr:response regulator [Opitutaceae bacterium]
MAALPHPPQTTWLQRISFALAVTLCLFGLLALILKFIYPDASSQIVPELAAVKANGVLAVFLLGAVLILIELGPTKIAGLALLPALIGALTLFEQAFHFNLGIDELLVRDYAGADSAAPGRMHFLAAACLLLAGAVLAWKAFSPHARARILGEACVGSVLAVIGSCTLIGYIAGLSTLCHWGAAEPLPAISAATLLLLGLALLTLAWRENGILTAELPWWLPLPVGIFSATLTLVLWTGLHEQELYYLGANTQRDIDKLASSITHELDRQTGTFERIASRWGQASDQATAVWETDATTQLSSGASPGCVAIEWVDPSRHTRWVYPSAGNEDAMNFDHAADPVRADALEAARLNAALAISGTVQLPTRGAGFVLYAPVYHSGKLAGFTAGEFVYQTFFNTVIQRLNLPESYFCSIEIAGQSVYDINAGRVQAGDPHALDKVFSIADRRMRITLTPLPEFLRQNRRYLPEFALIAGLGITLLLGLSVHLARSARAGQHATELSNQKLIAENEERRRVEAMLKVSDERLRLALDSTHIGIFEWQIPSNKFYYSPSIWTMLGYDPGALSPSPKIWADLIHPEDLPGCREIWEQQRRGEAPFIDPEFRVHAAGGAWRWVYVRSRGLTNTGAPGAPTRIICTIQDITARKEAELALRQSQAATRKLSLVAAKTDNLVLIGSPDGCIEWVNESFSRVMEYSLEEIVGRNPANFLVGPDTKPRTIRRIRAAMTRGKGFSTDIINYSKSGQKYHLSLEIQPVFNEGGLLENFIAIAADITARVETEANLRRAKSEADAASRAKSEFLASMSHEIRTPMNGVIGMTSLLMETPLTPEQRDYVHTIRSSGDALLTIINDILDFSKIESGKMELENLPFELASTIEDALDLFAVQSGLKKLELTYVIDPAVPAWISGDVTRLRQVLVNLVNNAVKFTPSGAISVEVRPHSDSPATLPLAKESGAPFLASLRLEFTVRDTGIGIPSDRINRLFQPFSQVDSSTTRKYGGTGLGLVICQRLCSLMGGEINVHSVRGQGSSFTFTILTEAVSTAADMVAPTLPAALKAGAILLVEDDAVNRARLQNFFATCGLTCLACADLAQTEEQLAKAPPLSAALIDSQLLETPTAQILREQLIAFDVPVLLLLAPGQSAPSKTEGPLPSAAAKKTGIRIRASVAKPIKTSALVRGLHQLFRNAADPAASADLIPLADEIPLEILLVEDNTVNQKVATRLLERLGYRADTVGNGLEALAALSARHYDLILMDVQMPEMDGFEATRTIRHRLPPERQPKIVAVTANALKGDRKRCLDSGMNDYITKPIKLDEIRDAIRRQFSSPAAVKDDDGYISD